jgi:phosphoesterase RecJ-like protein
MTIPAEVTGGVKQAGTILISGHRNPDGDCTGSMLALAAGLRCLGKTVYTVSRDPVPVQYRRLPGVRDLLKTTDVVPDLAVAVDCSRKDVLGAPQILFEKAAGVLEIDHHDQREPFGNLHLIDTSAASVGEIVYSLLMELEVPIDRDMAMNMLTSIIVETNSFRLPAVRPRTFEICARLLETGIDFLELTDMVYWSQSKQAVILSGICFSRSRFLKGDRLVWSIVKLKDFERVRGKDENVDAVADDMRAIKGVRVAILFREKEDNTLRVSLRSKGRINVGRLAEQFGGGGHNDVAGCVIPNSRHAMRKVVAAAEALLK